MYTYFITFFWLRLLIYQDLLIYQVSLLEGFKQKEIFFNVTLIINTFLSKSIKTKNIIETM